MIWAWRTRFNSSVGILSVGTWHSKLNAYRLESVSIPQSEFCPLGPERFEFVMTPEEKFQFLSRNSVRWDRKPRHVFVCSMSVSIPQSEFCPLGHSQRGQEEIER